MSRATEGRLAHLHNLVTEAMITELDNAARDELPVSPQMFSAIGKFLKDNEITCAIDTDSATGELADKMQAMREKRKNRVRDVPIEESIYGNH